MAETVARRGGITVIPQDIPPEVLKSLIHSIKQAHTVFDTPITLSPNDLVTEALSLINKRAHGAIIVTSDGKPVGIFTENDAISVDKFSPLKSVMSPTVFVLPDSMTAEGMYRALTEQHLSVAPVVDKAGYLVGIMTTKGAIRSGIYPPNVDKNNRLKVAVAIGINGNVAEKVKVALNCLADVLVVDTAHGHQKKMIDAIKAARKAGPKATIVAGNVVTKEATADLIAAGADIVKVGVGPGAMCTTRVMTGVGRPQFSAVLECSAEARKHGKYVWADGGIRYPRDIALAIAAGASSVMFASWFAGTYESAGDLQKDSNGNLYKESFGMASRRAVMNRTKNELLFERAKKEMFEEGISSSKFIINPAAPSVEDIIDDIAAGLRSACSYTGAHNLQQFYEKAKIGIQTQSGYDEGKPVAENWK
jgi:IMP dehydrogenase